MYAFSQRKLRDKIGREKRITVLLETLTICVLSPQMELRDR